MLLIFETLLQLYQSVISDTSIFYFLLSHLIWVYCVLLASCCVLSDIGSQNCIYGWSSNWILKYFVKFFSHFWPKSLGWKDFSFSTMVNVFLLYSFQWRFAFLSFGRPEYLQDSDIVSTRFQVCQSSVRCYFYVLVMIVRFCGCPWNP